MPKGQMRSVEASRFSMVPRSDVPRSAFDVSHFHKTTFGSGYLIPVYVDEVLPGDSHRVRMSAFVRTSTAVVPVMDNLVLESHFFFVPNRLLWDNFQRLMGEKESPTDTTVFLMPYVDVTAANAGPNGFGTIYDYMGITIQAAAGTVRVGASPFRAYNLIWNEWFRDEHLNAPAPFNTGDGPDVEGDYAIRVRNKRHDYFTSARPWPAQPANMGAFSGNALDPLAPGQNFLMGTWGSQIGAPVSGYGYVSTQVTAVGAGDVKYPGGRTLSAVGTEQFAVTPRVLATGVDGYPDIKVLVSDIRTATLVQQMLERDARGGTRYTELVRRHFGVASPDARLQRPEYLGGGRTYVNVAPIAQTSENGTTLLGEQAGIGTAEVYNHGFSQSFTEHGYVIGLVSVRADLTYQQGIHRMWYRRSRFEFYWPGLNGLSEQAIQSREIFADGTATDSDTFGYQERWSEYKWKPSRTSGLFRSSSVTPLDMWHFGQYFATRPLLNDVFVRELPPVGRVLQVTGNFAQQFLGDFLFDARLVRCMPMYSLPGMGARL